MVSSYRHNVSIVVLIRHKLETGIELGTTRILFLIYINDLQEGVTSKTFKFANHTTNLFRKNKGNGDK